MYNNYRDIKNDLVQCPFNPAHKVKKCRLITHKKICPDKHNKGYVQCPFDPNHQVTIENLDKHKAKCPSRVIINSDLEKEMEEFIKNKNAGKFQDNSLTKEVDKENTQNNYNIIEGLNSEKIKQKNDIKKIGKNQKDKKQEKKEKAIDLETITNKELFNFIFNDNMVIEYHSDSSENNDDDDDYEEEKDKKEYGKSEDEKSED